MLFSRLLEGYHKPVSAGDCPNCLSLQPTGVAIPGIGNDYSVSCLWVDDDHEEGRKWIDQIAALSTCHEKMVDYGVYGRARTLNFKTLPPKADEILAQYKVTIPTPGSLFSMQYHRGPGHLQKAVFLPCPDYYWLKIIAT
ncbi:hypothetical protein DER46DRAFT_666681 [Fusarium sp. MPI-SDFR-AT-0072]|nr:hypothetical protein DER46DRAFT_666681 [Fusarium sp. MPI-SDFR-AT-0072]